MAEDRAKGFVLENDVTGNGPRVTGYRFGPFDLNPVEGTLARNGSRVRVQDLPFRLLLMLVTRAGEVVSREEVRQHLWPGNTYVEFDNSLGVAVRKVREALNDNAEAPHYLATIPRRGYRFVALVTVQIEESPASPIQSETLPVSEPIPSVATAQSRDTTPRMGIPLRFPGGYWLLAGTILTVAIAAIAWRVYEKAAYVSPQREPQPEHRDDNSAETARLRRDENPTDPALLRHDENLAEPLRLRRDENPQPVRLRRSVAILGFRNLRGRPEDAWLSPVFSEMLDTELGTRGDLRMVPGEDIERIEHQVPSIAGGTLSKTTLEHLHNNPGADVVILGAYLCLPEKDRTRIRLDLRAQDTTNGETIAEEAITGNQNDLFDLAARAGSSLRVRLGLTPNSMGDASTARVALPANERSARLYVAGREKLWAFELLAARDLLVEAVAADPKFPLAHSALSEAWWHLGYQVKARAEAQLAKDLGKDLSQEDRLLIDGQYWRAINDRQQTVQTYRALFHLYPDNLDYGLLLATAEIPIQPSAALATLAALRRLPPPLGNDARIDMTEASAWIGQDLAKARSAAQIAIEKGRAQGRSLLVSRTYDFLCEQGAGVGTSAQEAIGDCEYAMRLDKESGNRNAAAMMLADLAGLRYSQGDMARSEAMFLNAIEEFRRVGNADGVATTMSNLGAVRLSRGDLPGAKKLLENAIPQYQAIEDKDGIALALSDLAELFRQKGELAVAEADDRRARATAEQIEDQSAVAYVLAGFGSILLDRGDLAGARQAYEESLAIRKRVGEKQNVGETQLALARVSVESGHPAQVEGLVRSLQQQFRQEQQADDALAAGCVLIDILLAQGKQSDAQAVVEQARTLAGKSENLAQRLAFAIATARVSLSSGSAEQATGGLNAVLKETRARGLLSLELSARLVAADAERKAGRHSIAQAQFLSLAQMARAKGFGLIARKAAAAA